MTAAGEIEVTVAANPSHLEAVDPVVEGLARAEQTDRSQGAGIHDPTVALPVLIHGDASFAGQGVVAETFNLHSLDGYSTGGTLHLIANNQVGFTTDPAEGRSTRYSSDLAKGFDVPIVHVNADDPEAAIAAIRLALAYREEFGHDVVVDLVGYRRFGHNEQDEAAYTQPLQTERIAQQPPVRVTRTHRSSPRRGSSTKATSEQMLEETLAELQNRARPAAGVVRGDGAAGRGADPDGHRSRCRHRGRSRSAARARRAAPARPGRLRGESQAGPAARAAARDPSTRAGSTGGTPRRWRSRRSSRRASRSGSRGRTPSAAPSRTGTPSSTTRRRARRTRRCSTSRPQARRSRSTTRRSPSTQRWRSSTGTRSPHPTRSSSGRRSSGTS